MSQSDVPCAKRFRSCADDDDSVAESSKLDDENNCCASSDDLRTDCRGVQEAKEVIAARRYDYHDHPADIQLHSWGKSTEEAIEALMVSMYGYMTDLSLVDEVYPYYFSGSGRDFPTMLYSLMEEALCAFQSEPFFVAKRFEVISLDLENFKVEARGFGESYDLETKHSQEADIKAITYSNMQIHIKPERTDLFVIVDI